MTVPIHYVARSCARYDILLDRPHGSPPAMPLSPPGYKAKRASSPSQIGRQAGRVGTIFAQPRATAHIFAAVSQRARK